MTEFKETIIHALIREQIRGEWEPAEIYASIDSGSLEAGADWDEIKREALHVWLEQRGPKHFETGEIAITIPEGALEKPFETPIIEGEIA